MAKHRPKNQEAAAPEGPRAPEPWDHIPRSGDDWVMPGLYTHPGRPWKGCFTFKRTRRAHMTGKQWENWQYTGCYQNEFMGLYLFMFQDLATRRLYPRRCALAPCRRMGICAGRKPPHGGYRYDIDPCVPPCVPDDYDTIEGMRRKLLEEYYAYGRKAGAPWAFRPCDANYGDSNPNFTPLRPPESCILPHLNPPRRHTAVRPRLPAPPDQPAAPHTSAAGAR